MALMAEAKKRSGFKKPDITPFIPKGMEDIVAKVTAAGLKVLYAPDMREDVMQAIQSEGEVAQKLGENVAGLMLTLDQKAPQGIPAEAMFPAAMELLGEAAELLVASGQEVFQDDYNTAAMQIMVELGRRMGATDDQIMQAAQGVVGEGGEDEAEEMPDEQPMPQGQGAM